MRPARTGRNLASLTAGDGRQYRQKPNNPTTPMAKVKSAPAGALDAPTPRPQGPEKNANGITAHRAPAPGPMLIENLGTVEQPNWALLDSQGMKVNPPFTAAQSLAYFIVQNKYASRIENLNELGNSHNPYSHNERVYKIADVALGKQF